MSVRRAGWTLHEMLISLAVMSGVLALAAQFAVAQLRLFRASAELATLRRDAGQASSIAASVVRGISPAAGDVDVALDSAIEVHAPIGTAVACSGEAGVVTLAMPSGPAGNTLASFSEAPQPGDRMFALRADSLGESWSQHIVAGSLNGDAVCPAFPSAGSARSLRLEDPAIVAAGTPLRFTRPIRLSLYRSGDGRWYLGARDWSSDLRRFNTIQPVAGPLRPYDEDGARSGLRFTYLGADGVELAAPVDRARIASVTVVARTSAGAISDSLSVTVALRNAR